MNEILLNLEKINDLLANNEAITIEEFNKITLLTAKIENKAVRLCEVSQQRELLNGWEKYEQKWEYGEFEDRGDLIDEYLKTI